MPAGYEPIPGGLILRPDTLTLVPDPNPFLPTITIPKAVQIPPEMQGGYVIGVTDNTLPPVTGPWFYERPVNELQTFFTVFLRNVNGEWEFDSIEEMKEDPHDYTQYPEDVFHNLR